MRFVSIASGSSGNCTLVTGENTAVLIDAGISCKRITDSLHGLNMDPRDLSAVFITHEHSDHINGLKTMAKKYGIPVYATAATIGRIKGDGHVDASLCNSIKPDTDIVMGDLTVHPFRITHDAVDPVGYRIEHGDKKVAVATDLGNFTEYTVSNLKNLDAVLLEANHDIRMLELGPYPYQLKRRILSDYGHLCNERSGQLLSEVLHDKLKACMLGHLSKENNYPDLALMAVKCEVDQADNEYRSGDFDIFVAERDNVSRIIEV
ncbi:MAG: MBL fold metallo-hydrolase [Lachnospiraceae bacterium]|nr:MBL fold metallo-hydrolase [Lachnospiraceae bacterium]